MLSRNRPAIRRVFENRISLPTLIDYAGQCLFQTCSSGICRFVIDVGSRKRPRIGDATQAPQSIITIKNLPPSLIRYHTDSTLGIVRERQESSILLRNLCQLEIVRISSISTIVVDERQESSVSSCYANKSTKRVIFLYFPPVSGNELPANKLACGSCYPNQTTDNIRIGHPISRNVLEYNLATFRPIHIGHSIWRTR